MICPGRFSIGAALLRRSVRYFIIFITFTVPSPICRRMMLMPFTADPSFIPDVLYMSSLTVVSLPVPFMPVVVSYVVPSLRLPYSLTAFTVNLPQVPSAGLKLVSVDMLTTLSSASVTT